MTRTKKIFVFFTICTSSAMVYFACKQSSNNTQENLQLSPSTVTFLPLLQPGDTPGNVNFVITPINDGNVNLIAKFTNGTPGLKVFCQFRLQNLGHPNAILPGYSSIQTLDANGAVDMSFNNVRCSFFDTTALETSVVFECETAQVPARPVNYLNGSSFMFACPFQGL